MRALVTGAGGFIGGHLVKSLLNKGYHVDAVDIKKEKDWHQIHKGAVNLCGFDAASRDTMSPVFFTDFDEVFNLAANMGGMGFIEKNRVACLRSVLINTNLIELAANHGVKKYFFASSACVYNTELQDLAWGAGSQGLKESDAYPAMAERGYGWEKLFSEMLCQEYTHERGLRTYIARFHNVYGPYGTYKGGREKAPAAICRKVIEAKRDRQNEIEVWGNGLQTRSFMYIDDCITGINRIMACDALVATPINLGSRELVSINELIIAAEQIAGAKRPLTPRYKMDAPIGVNGRNSDNSMILKILGWEPSIPLRVGLEKTYNWIEGEINRAN